MRGGRRRPFAAFESRDLRFMGGYAVKWPFEDVPFGVKSEGVVDEVLPYFSRSVTDGCSTSRSLSTVPFEFSIELPVRRDQRFQDPFLLVEGKADIIFQTTHC